jgi:crossover junction endonuclease MUS81
MPQERKDLRPLVGKAIDLLLQQAKAHNLKTRYSYMKARRALDAAEEPIYDLCDVSKIKCIGDKVMERVKECMAEELDGERERPEAASSHRRTREYIPGYRTGAYAILKALWLEDGVSKHTIAYRAKEYCDGDFDLGTRHSAMSSLRTLLKKRLVLREDRCRYYLTEEGRRLASAMFMDTSLVEPKSSGVTLVIDSREVKHRRSRSFFQTHFDQEGIRHETRMLDLGDFVWIRNERMCDFIIERKQGSDFVSSIVDGRFKEQKQRLMKCGIKRVLYLVEGLRPAHAQQIGCELSASCLMRSKLEGLTVIETGSIKESCEVICLVDGVVRAKYEGPSPHEVNLCEDSDSAGMSYAGFIDKGGKGRNRNVRHMLYLALLSVRGVGHSKAEALAKRYRTISNFMRQSERPGFIEELRSLEIGGKRLPKKNVDDIAALILGPSMNKDTVHY